MKIQLSKVKVRIKTELSCLLRKLIFLNPMFDFQSLDLSIVSFFATGTNLSVSVVATFGNLDCLFNNLPTSETLAGDDGVVAARRHLAAQEHYMTLVWATSVKRRKEIHHALLTCIENETTLTQNQIQSMDNSTRLILDSKRSSSVVLFDPSVIDAVEGQGVVGCQTEGNGTSTSILPIDIGQAELISKLLDSTRIAQSMKEMARRTTTKLMERGFSAGIGEGRMSPTLQADLAVQLDDHLRELCLSSQFSERFNDGNDEPYEEALERMAEDWGDWFDDDYVWSPGDSAKVETPIILLPDEALDEGQESIEDFMERIDREWADWV